MILRQGHGWPTVKGSLACSGNSSRMVNINTKISSRINAGKNPIRLAKIKSCKSHPYTVCRSPIDSIAIFFDLLNHEWSINGDTMSTPRMRFDWRDRYDTGTPPGSSSFKSTDSIRIKPIVVCEK
jgi:hypothetical protein